MIFKNQKAVNFFGFTALVIIIANIFMINFAGVIAFRKKLAR